MSLLQKNGQKKFYLHNEVFIFLNLLESLGRLEDLRVFLLANAVTITNPYFLFFDINVPYNSDIALYKDNLILVQIMKNEKYREAKRQTRFRKISRSVLLTSLMLQIISSHKIYLHLQKRKNGTAKFSFAFIYLRNNFAVFGQTIKSGKIYISKDFDQSSPLIFSCSLEDHKDNTLFLKSARRYHCWQTLIENFEIGNVRFENQKVKNLSMRII